jgi:hypothetical protein
MKQKGNILIGIIIGIGLSLIAYLIYTGVTYNTIETKETTEESKKDLKVVANDLFDNFLKLYLSDNMPLHSRLKNYTIDDIDIYYEEDNCFTFRVGFSVEPYTTGWTAGNGEEKNGWYVDKSMYIDVIKINDDYYIREFVGTASGPHGCDEPINNTYEMIEKENKEVGFKFKYPDKFFNSEPEIIISDNYFGLAATTLEDFLNNCTEKVKINNINYCLGKTEKKINDSFYTTYTYSTIKNQKYVTIKLITKETICDVYEPLKEAYQNCYYGKVLNSLKFNETLATFKFNQ